MSVKITDYDSREQFIRDLKIWHHDKNLKNREFYKIKSTSLDFKNEITELKKDLEYIKVTWNNQSISSIRNHVENSGNEESLEVMRNQENDKIKAGIDIFKSMYHVKQVENNSIWVEIAKFYPLDNPLVRLHIQFPGDVTQWHTDIFAPFHNLLPSETNIKVDDIGKDMGVRRILIALDDWDWGQCFMFGADIWHQWKSGDAIYWDYGVPHCAANMGFTPRISLSITGILKSDINEYKI